MFLISINKINKFEIGAGDETHIRNMGFDPGDECMGEELAKSILVSISKTARVSLGTSQ